VIFLTGIGAGEPVRVMGRDGLTLFVELAGDESAPSVG
jgi:hypothetical protein